MVSRDLTSRVVNMSSEDNFPGLNKRHGFFKVIERNQRDRDEYHQRVEHVKEARKEELRREKRARRKPPRELYRPPGSRGQRSNEDPSLDHGIYRIEIEVGPDKWHQHVVEKAGQADVVSKTICRQYRMSIMQRKAISEMISEFEDKLTIL